MALWPRRRSGSGGCEAEHRGRSGRARRGFHVCVGGASRDFSRGESCRRGLRGDSSSGGIGAGAFAAGFLGRGVSRRGRRLPPIREWRAVFSEPGAVGRFLRRRQGGGRGPAAHPPRVVAPGKHSGRGPFGGFSVAPGRGIRSPLLRSSSRWNWNARSSPRRNGWGGGLRVFQKNMLPICVHLLRGKLGVKEKCGRNSTLQFPNKLQFSNSNLQTQHERLCSRTARPKIWRERISINSGRCNSRRCGFPWSASRSCACARSGRRSGTFPFLRWSRRTGA